MANVLVRAPQDRLPFNVRFDRHHYLVKSSAPFAADPADVANLLLHGCSLVPEETTETVADALTTLGEVPVVAASEAAPVEPITFYGETAGADASA